MFILKVHVQTQSSMLWMKFDGFIPRALVM